MVTEEAARGPATLVFPPEADRSESSLLKVGRGIGILRWSSQGCVERAARGGRWKSITVLTPLRGPDRSSPSSGQAPGSVA
jgi:hypothetical protein